MRLLKQFLYGTLYILIFAGITWGIYFIKFKPAPSCFDNRQNGGETGVDCGGSCISCEIKNLKPLSIETINLFANDRVYSASAKVKNPNSDFSASSFDYVVNFYDKNGDILQSIKNSSFVYPNEAKPIIEAGIKITNGIPNKAEIKIDNQSVVWEKPENFFRPNYDLKNVSTTIENGRVIINGDITNKDNFTISKVIADVILVDKSGKEIGASKYEIKNLGNFATAFFKMTIPLNNDQINSINLEATTNNIFVEVLK